VRDHLQAGGQQPGRDQPLVVHCRPGQRDAEADHDQPAVLHAGVGDHPVQPILHGRVRDAQQRADGPEQEQRAHQPAGRTAE
jgi:hypothetical protein